MIEYKVILLGLKPYDFTDDKGNRIAGASAWVLPEKSTADVAGLIPVKYSVPYDQVQPLMQVGLPASATLKLDFALGSSKPKFSSFTNLTPIDLAV